MKTKLFSTILLLVMSAAGVFGDVLRVGSGSPYSTITSALATAKAGDEVWVTAGTYREAELIIPSGVSVYGGFTGSETKLSERNFTANATILDGSGAHRVATVSGHLDGFTLRNGRTGDNGGGAYVKAGGTLANCIAFANEAGYDGGAVFAEEGGTVKNSLLRDNRAGNDGAAISGLGAYSAVHVTATGNEFTNAPEIKKAIPVPAALIAGQQLNVAEPNVNNADEVDPHGSTVLLKGWELDGHAISMPYTVTYADNGKKLRFWAANAVGVGMSNEVTVTVTWTVTSAVQLITPKAVCEGLTLADAGITAPTASPAPIDGATYAWYIDGTPVSGLDYVLQYTDNGKLLTCEIKNNDGSIVGARTPAVRLAVMKAPEILLSSVASLSIEDGEPLCLPTPVVISNGSDITAQGWKWTTDGNATTHDFNSCDKATPAMNGAKVYYTAENGCPAGAPVTKDYLTTLTVTNPVGEFLQTASALCAGMTLEEGIAFADGGNTGDYYIGDTQLGNAGTTWDAVKITALTTAHNLQVLRFSYNGGKSERRLTLTVHAVPAITTNPAEPGSALCLGDAHTLTVEAKGDNLSYQWERSVNSTDGADGDWNNVPGATTAACRLTADATAYYRCTVEGICVDKNPGVAGGKITSTPAKLTVNDRPVIPMVTFDAGAGELDICEGIELLTILTVKTPTLSGTPATAEGWTLGGVKVSAGYKASATDNGKVLGYWASNDCGERTITFPTGILAVTSRPELLQSPADVSAEENSSVRLSVLTGAGVKYQWYVVGSNPADPTDGASELPGKTAASCVFTAAELTDADLAAGKKETKYYCRVTALTDVCKGRNDAPTTIDPTAPAYVLSDVATVTVNRRTTDITITSQPDAFPETCAGTDKTITVKATGRGGLACKWYSGSTEMTDPDNGTITTTVSAITPAPTDALAADKQLVSEFTPNAAGTYYCIITSTDNPGGVRSTQSVLTIHALPVLTDISAAEHTQTLCRGTDLSLRVSATGTAVSYEWQRSTDGGTNYTALGETDSRLRTAVTDDAVYRCVVKATCMEKVTIDGAPKYDATAGGIPTSAVTVTMAMKPSVAAAGNFTPAAFSKCEGEAIALSDANVVVDDNHKAVAAAGRWWTLGGQQVANDYVVTRNDNGKTVGYSATNECGTTTVTFAAMKLTVDEKPQVTQDPADVSTTEDSRVRLSVAASGSHLTYQWQKKAHGDGEDKWADIADEPSAITPALSFTAANITAGAFDGADVLTDYRCRVGTTNACSVTTVYSAAATVTVTRQKSVVSIRRQPVSYEVCNSAAAYSPGFTVEVAGSGHFIYKWYNITDPTTPVRTEPATGSTAATSDTYTPAKGDAAAGTYYCVVTSTDDDEGVQSQAVTLTVSLAPEVIDITPAAAKICEGGSVTLGVDAEGSALTYQWYQQKGAAKDPDTDTKKGTAATYTPVGLDATARFYCIVGSGSVCTETATSETVVVTVEKAPKITTQPVSRTVCGGTGINLTVVAENADRYEWYYNGTPKGGNSATLSDVTDGGVYTCVVSKTGGVCGEVTSVPALITAAGTPTVNLGSRDNLTACQGDLVTLPTPEVETGGSVIVPERTGWYLSGDADQKLVSSFIAGNSNVTYNYKLTYKCSADATQGDEQVLIAGMPTLGITVTPAPTVTGVLKAVEKKEGETVAQTDIQTTAPASAGNTLTWTLNDTPVKFGYTVSAADHGKVFKVTATNACGQSATLGSTSTLTVLTAPQILEQPRGMTLCEGAGTVTLTVKASGSGLSYQWMKDGANVANAAGASGNDVVSGATDATLTLTKPAAARSGVYTCRVSGMGGDAVVSAPAVVTVNAKVSVTSAPQNVAICSGNSATLQIEATGALSYAWTKDANATVIGNASSLTVSEAGTYKCVVTGKCGTATSTPATVTVNTAPSLTTQPKSQTVCSDKSFAALTVSGTGTPIPTYQWYANGGKSSTGTSLTPTAEGTYYCVASNACGSVASSTATLVKVKAPVVTIAGVTTYTECAGMQITLPTPSVEANGSTIVPASTGWVKQGATTIVASPLTVSSSTAGGYQYKVTYTGACSGSVVSTNSVTVAIVASPSTPTLSSGNVATELCEGESVTLPTVNRGSGYTDGWWELDGEPKGTNSSYKVNAADNGKTFKYVNVNRCGVKATSAATAALRVKQPARITSLLTAPVVFQSGAALNSKVSVPTANNADPAKTKWTLNGTKVELAKTVALTDDAARLTYSVDNGCTTGIGAGGIDETSTTVRVWNVPSFTNTGSTAYVAAGQIGSAYAYPAPPTVAMNNCTLIAAGWVVEGSDAKATFLNPAAAASDADNGKKIVWQVRYKIPHGDDSRHVNGPVMGTLSPWDVPTMPESGANIYTEVTTGAQNWTNLPNVTVIDHRTTIKSKSWVYGPTYTLLDSPYPVDLAAQLQKPLYRKVVYTIPGNPAERTVYLRAGVLYPWRKPVIAPFTLQKWTGLCNNKTFADVGRNMPIPSIDVRECTITKTEWKIGSTVVTDASKPTVANDKGTITYELSYVAPDKSSGTLSTPVVTMEVNTLPTINVKRPVPGDELVGVIGSNIATALGVTASARYGTVTLTNSLNRDVIERGDHDKGVYFYARNTCGETTKAAGKILIKGNPAIYYSGIKKAFKTDDNEDFMIYHGGSVYRVRLGLPFTEIMSVVQACKLTKEEVKVVGAKAEGVGIKYVCYNFSSYDWYWDVWDLEAADNAGIRCTPSQLQRTGLSSTAVFERLDW